MDKRSQTSVELTMLVGVSLAILLASTVLLYNYASYSTKKIVGDQIDDIGKSMVRNAEIISNYGEPARRVVKYDFPTGVLNIYIEENSRLIFNMTLYSGEQAFVYPSNVNITGTFTPDDCFEGKKDFLFEADGDTVRIERWLG